MAKTHPAIKQALLDLFAAILEHNEEEKAMFWLDYSGHCSSFSVRKAEHRHDRLYGHLGLFSGYTTCEDPETLKFYLDDIAEKKRLVLETAAKWTDDKIEERKRAAIECKRKSLMAELEQLKESTPS
jgi:hypothetical protein